MLLWHVQLRECTAIYHRAAMALASHWLITSALLHQVERSDSRGWRPLAMAIAKQQLPMALLLLRPDGGGADPLALNPHTGGCVCST